MDYYEPTVTQWERNLSDLRRRLLWALGLIMLVTLIGISGFSIIDPSSGLIRAFFMTAITLTTVGHSEEIPVDTDGARVFTAVLILVGMGSVLYFVSTGTAFLLEGQLGHVFRRRRMERDLAGLSGHHLVCGSNLRIDEVRIPGGSPVIGRPTYEIGLEELPQVLLLAVRQGDGHWEYNPPRSYRLKAGVVLIFLGTPEDSRRLREGLAGGRVSESALATSLADE